MSTKVWNPYFVAYARFFGKRPEDMKQIGRTGIRNYGFIRWIQMIRDKHEAENPDTETWKLDKYFGDWLEAQTFDQILGWFQQDPKRQEHLDFIEQTLGVLPARSIVDDV